MDRLPTLRLCLTALVLAATVTGCDGDEPSETAEPAPSRVMALPAEESDAEDPETFCEVHAEGADAPAFAWPEAMEGDAPAASSGWRWVNVWATWCQPCVEEMPRLETFEEQLEADGAAVELAFLSADSDAVAITAFREEHPSHPTGPRVSDTEALRAWLQGFGLDEGAPLPIHLFVDPAGKVRCARTAAIGDDDYESVKALISG